MSVRRWMVVTPEYPPAAGGVSGYSHQLAEALAARGDHVEVWAPGASEPGARNAALRFSLPDRFGPGSIAALGRALREGEEPPTVLLQYVPQGLGLRGMNLPFLLWLARCPAPLWVMFHEVVFPFRRGQPLRRQLLAGGTRAMLAVIASRADRVLVSIPAWAPYLERWARLKRPPEWAPVPSNLPNVTTRSRAEIHANLSLDEGHVVLGYFGKCSEPTLLPLEASLEPLLSAHPERRLLMIGQGSLRFAERMRARGAFGARILATGELEGGPAADHLAACDVAVFPFSDGASGRRTSMMAALSLGVPVVTTEGFLSEPLWRSSGAVALAPAGDPAAFARCVDQTLSNPSVRAALGAAGRRLYDEQFSLERHLSRLFSVA